MVKDGEGLNAMKVHKQQAYSKVPIMNDATEKHLNAPYIVE